MKRSRLVVALLFGLVLSFPLANQDSPETSKTFAYATYKEMRGPVTILVDTLPASFRDDQPYVPFPVAIGVQGYGKQYTISPEIFTLIDQTGVTYAAASHLEVREAYPKLLFDRGLTVGRPVTAQQFELSRQLPSSFYPVTGPRIDRVHLDGYTWFRDVIYFPRPRAGLGGVMTFRMYGGGFDSPLDVRVRVPLPGVKVR